MPFTGKLPSVKYTINRKIYGKRLATELQGISPLFLFLQEITVNRKNYVKI